jgi:hypothetical protein
MNYFYIPFDYMTEIQYFLSKNAHATLILYDINGRVVSNLIDKNVLGGWHSLIVNGSGLNSGTYILRLSSEGKSVMKKINKMD